MENNVFVVPLLYQDPHRRYTRQDLSDVQYITDPRFSVLGIAIGNDGECDVFPGDTKEWAEKLQSYVGGDKTLVLHQGRTFCRALALRYEILPRSIQDTHSMARYFGFPDPAFCPMVKRLLKIELPEIAMDAQNLTSLTTSKWRRIAESLLLYTATMARLYEKFSAHIPECELQLIEQTYRLCLRQNDVDMSLFEHLEKKSRSALEKTQPAIIDNLHKVDNLKRLIKDETGAKVEQTRKTASLPKGARPILSDIWEARSQDRTLNLLKNLKTRMILPDTNKAFIDLNYSKAVTHRWSGGGAGQPSFNIQNIGSTLRPLFVPNLGSCHLKIDLSQIECRIAAWYAKEKEMLDAFSNHRDLYCEFGEHIFGHVLDPSIDADKRKVCKETILGLNFGMGVDLFSSTLEQRLDETCIRLLLDSLNVKTLREAAGRLVATYRRTFPNLAEMPRLHYYGFINIVAQAEKPCSKRIGFRPIDLFFSTTDRSLSVNLPTGRRLYYRDVLQELRPSKFRRGKIESVLSFCDEDGRREIKYAAPFENVVQATARDILADKMLLAEESGFTLVRHTHDDAVFEVPDPQRRESMETLAAIFSAEHEDCPGLPLACTAEMFLSPSKSNFIKPEIITPKEVIDDSQSLLDAEGLL